MSYKNVFTGGADGAESAEQSARQLQKGIPGAFPERKGVDPELYDDIPDEQRDPKIVSEVAPGALNIMGNFLTPLFQNFQTIAADQLAVSESPGSASSMASSTQQEAAKTMQAETGDEGTSGTPPTPGTTPKLGM